MKNKQLLKLLSAICLAALIAIPLTVGCAAPEPAPAPAPAPAPHEIVTVSQWGGPFGVSSHLLAMATEDISRKYHLWLRVKGADTPGSIYMLKAIDDNPVLWDNTIGTLGAVTEWLGAKGLPPFEKKHLSYRALLNLNVLSQWLVTLDPNIKTPQDLIGKKIALGYTTQINWGYEPTIMIEEGWGLKDKVDISYVGTTPALHALLDGTADAAITGIYLNPVNFDLVKSPVLVELEGSGKDIYHIPWGREAIEKAVANVGLPLSVVTLPMGSIKGQTEDMELYVDSLYLTVRPTFPDSVAYEFVKLWIEHYEKFSEYHAVGKLVTPEAMAFGFTKQKLHPGAVRAYEEAGITIPEK